MTKRWTAASLRSEVEAPGIEGEKPTPDAGSSAVVAPDHALDRETKSAIDGAADESLTFTDVTDEQIENAIVRAMLAGKTTVAEALTATLARRQNAKAPSNVVKLRTRS